MNQARRHWHLFALVFLCIVASITSQAAADLDFPSVQSVAQRRLLQQNNSTKPLPKLSSQVFVELTFLAIGVLLFVTVIIVFFFFSCWPEEISDHEKRMASEQEKRKLTVSQCIDHLGYGKAQYMLMFICGFAQFATSTEVMILSFLMPELRSYWNLQGWQAALIGSMVIIGKLLGAMIWSWMSDRFGRRITIIVNVIVLVVFGFLSAFAPNYWVMLILRLLVGLGVGGDVVPFTLFSELLPTKYRSQSLLNVQTFWSIGSILTPLFAMVFLPKTTAHVALFGQEGWRYMIVFCSIPALLMTPFIFFLPESPHYLFISKRRDEIEGVINRIAYFNEKAIDFEVNLETEGVSQEALEKQKGKLTEFFKLKYLWVMIMTVVVFISGGLCYYGVSFLTPVYFSAKSTGIYDTYISSTLSALAEFPGQVTAYILLSKIGRKLTLSFAFFNGAFVLFLLTPSPYILLVVYAAFSRAGLIAATNINWVVVPDAFPTALRTSALGILVACARVSSSTAPFITNYLVTKESSLPAVIIFGVACIIAGIAALLIPVNTYAQQLVEFNKDDVLAEHLLVPEKKSESNSDNNNENYPKKEENLTLLEGASEKENIVVTVADENQQEAKAQQESQ